MAAQQGAADGDFDGWHDDHVASMIRNEARGAAQAVESALGGPPTAELSGPSRGVDAPFAFPQQIYSLRRLCIDAQGAEQPLAAGFRPGQGGRRAGRARAVLRRWPTPCWRRGRARGPAGAGAAGAAATGGGRAGGGGARVDRAPVVGAAAAAAGCGKQGQDAGARQGLRLCRPPAMICFASLPPTGARHPVRIQQPASSRGASLAHLISMSMPTSLHRLFYSLWLRLTPRARRASAARLGT
jgi:hypothetical protein